MRLFRSRGRHEAGPTTSGPLERAVALYRDGDYAGAEAVARGAAAAEAGAGLGGAQALSIVALAAGAQGRHEESLAAHDQALTAFVQVTGPDHWLVLKARSDRAQQLAQIDRYEECEAECAAVARAAARGQGPEMRMTALAARNGQVFALHGLGRHGEAEAVAREVLAAHGEADRLALVLRLGLARSLTGQGRHQEALAETDRAEQVRRGLPDKERGAESGAVDVVAATALLGLGRIPEARERAAAAHDLCASAFGPTHRRTREARALLDRLDGA